LSFGQKVGGSEKPEKSRDHIKNMLMKRYAVYYLTVLAIGFLPLTLNSECVAGSKCKGEDGGEMSDESCGPGSCGCWGTKNEAGDCIAWTPSECCKLLT